MRISDWSSDVCSSDLARRPAEGIFHPRPSVSHDDPRVEICPGTEQHTLRTRVQELSSRFQEDEAKTARVRLWDACGAHTPTAILRAFQCVTREQDRKRVVKGKSVSVRVDLGGRRIMKKKKDRESKQRKKN